MNNIEHDILSALMFDAENMAMALERGVNSDWFGRAENGLLFIDLSETFAKSPWNQRNSVNILSSAGIYTKHPFALEVSQNTPAWAFKVEDVASSLEVLAGEYASRIIMEASKNAQNSLVGGEDAFDAALTLSEQLSSLELLSGASTERMLPELTNDAFAIDTKIANGERVGLPFPWLSFQRSTFGIPTKAVTPLGGRDGKGKSRLATALAHFWVSQGIPILYFPFEDSSERMVSNIAATHGEYDMFTIRRGHVPPAFMPNHRKSLDRVSRMPLYVDDCPSSAERIVSKIARHKRKFGIQGVILDGFKDIVATKGENRTQQENHMMSVIDRAAKKYDVAIITVSHLNKIEDDKWISRQSITGSGNQNKSARMTLIYQDCAIPEAIKSKYGGALIDDCVVLDCQKASYGDKGYVVLRPNFERGGFLEIAKEEVVPAVGNSLRGGK